MPPITSPKASHLSPVRRLVDPQEHEEDHLDLADGAASPCSPAIRPLRLDRFMGQQTVKENLAVFLEAARQRSKAMDHILLHGPPGLGKTTLAHIVAKELGVNFHATSGPIISKAGDLAALLTNLGPKDVLFIDEIHRLNPVVEETLYPAMEDYHLDLVIGEGPSARSLRIDIAPFTLIGATTRAGLMTRPLRERFGIPLRLQFYTPTELCQIVTLQAATLNLDTTPDGALEIAKRSRGTPRIAGRLLRRVADYALVDGTLPITRAVADGALSRLEVDGHGLDSQDRRYLSHIAIACGGGPVGIETLAAALSEPRDVLEDVLEPFLLQEGFIQRTPRGRILSSLAYTYLGLDQPASPKALF